MHKLLELSLNAKTPIEKEQYKNQLLYTIFKEEKDPQKTLDEIRHLHGETFFEECGDNHAQLLRQEQIKSMLGFDYIAPPKNTPVFGYHPSAIDIALKDNAPLQLIENLIAFGVSVNRTHNFNEETILLQSQKTSLQVAMDAHRDDAVALILSKKPELSDNARQSALAYAARNNYPNYFRAIYEADPKLAQVILQSNVHDGGSGNSLLWVAIQSAYPEIALELVLAEPDLLIKPVPSIPSVLVHILDTDTDYLRADAAEPAPQDIDPASVQKPIPPLKDRLATAAVIKEAVKNELVRLCAGIAMQMKSNSTNDDIFDLNVAIEALRLLDTPYGNTKEYQEWLEQTLDKASFYTAVSNLVKSIEKNAEVKKEQAPANPEDTESQQKEILETIYREADKKQAEENQKAQQEKNPGKSTLIFSQSLLSTPSSPFAAAQIEPVETLAPPNTPTQPDQDEQAKTPKKKLGNNGNS